MCVSNHFHAIEETLLVFVLGPMDPFANIAFWGLCDVAAEALECMSADAVGIIPYVDLSQSSV